MSSDVQPHKQFKFIIGNEAIPYVIVRNSRLSRMRIHVSLQDGFVVSIPEKASEQLAHTFFSSQQTWILRQWKRLALQRERFSHAVYPFLEKNSVMYLGNMYQLVVEVGNRHWPPVVVEDGVITVYCVAPDLAEKILFRWYRQQARAVITGALELYRSRMKVAYSSLSIKDQKTRWGSCSRSGNVNFSWRLILAPKSVLDYVVVHELAHLREMNHSQRFWNIVEAFCPEYRQAEKWLKDNGVGLQL